MNHFMQIGGKKINLETHQAILTQLYCKNDGNIKYGGRPLFPTSTAKH